MNYYIHRYRFLFTFLSEFIILFFLECQFQLVHFGIVRVGIYVETNTAKAHKRYTHQAEHSGSVEDVSCPYTKWYFGHSDNDPVGENEKWAKLCVLVT